MTEKYYIVETAKPVAHYIIKMTNTEYKGAIKFLNGVANPEYAIGHSGTKFEILTPGYDTITEAEEAISNILF